MFEPKAPGIELLESALKELEQLGEICLPSLNAFLEKNKLYMKKEDYRVLRSLMYKNKKWKLVRVYDYKVIRRGKKK